MSKKPKKKPAYSGPTVQCPKCRRKQPKRGGHDTLYWCTHCRCQLDDDPFEGGDYDDRDPSRRLERIERQQGHGRR